MSKGTQRSVQQELLDADEELRAAGENYSGETDETVPRLRDAALRFADAWRACEPAGKGRP